MTEIPCRHRVLVRFPEVPVRSPERRRGSKNSPRRGNVLILFAMMLFGLMALAALVIDIGFARLAQQQMQSAVDSAAVEGLRFRDELPPGFDSSADRDLARRQHVQTWVSRMFDDDLMTTSEDEYNFGAGPMVNFDDGAGDPNLFASQEMSIPETPVYKPTGVNALQINQSDAVEGDMLAGNHTDSWPVQENGDYQRTDFSPGDGDSFLVRMRRTNDPDGLDRQENVSSAGPPLPYLFARGTLMNRGLLGSGITARATAIADLQPVVRVGVARSADDLSGTLGLTISADEWGEMAPGDSNLATPTGARIIGEPISIPVNIPSPPGDGYVGLHQTIDGTDRLIGFVLASSDSDGNITMLPDAAPRPWIASENASAVFAPPSSADGTPMPDAATLRAVIEANRLLPTHDDGGSLRELNDILHAPVSVR